MEKMRNIIEFIGTSAMLIYLSGLQRHFSQISLNKRKILLKSLKFCYCILFFINKWCCSMHLLAKIFFSWKIRLNAQGIWSCLENWIILHEIWFISDKWMQLKKIKHIFGSIIDKNSSLLRNLIHFYKSLEIHYCNAD